MVRICSLNAWLFMTNEGTRRNSHTASILCALTLPLPDDQDQEETSKLYRMWCWSPNCSERRKYGLHRVLRGPDKGLGSDRIGRFGRENLLFGSQTDAGYWCIQGHVDRCQELGRIWDLPPAWIDK